MKVIINKPTPAPVPPTWATYDLLGLSRDEYMLIKALVGRTASPEEFCRTAGVPAQTMQKLYGSLLR